MCDILKIPEFLDVIYLRKILQQVHRDLTIDVLNFTIEPAVASGNNYASLLLRSHIKYTKNNKRNNIFVKRVIIKTVLADTGAAKVISDVKLYEKELVMYDRILPKFQKIMLSVGDNDQLYVPPLYIDYKNKVLIFNDLKVAGFATCDRIMGLDWDHVNLVIAKIAKFHACSMVLAEQSDETFREFREPCIADNFIGNQFFKRMFVTCVEEVRGWTGYEKYAIKLEKIKDLMLLQGEQCYKKSRYPIKVLLHGDLWTSNIMFKHDQDGKLAEDAILIDFQLGCYGAPVLDIIQFFYTSTSDHIKRGSFIQVLKQYHEELVRALKMLRFQGKRPTMFQLYHQYCEMRFYEIFNVIVVYPIMINTQTKDADMTSLVGDTEQAAKFRKQMFKSRKFIKTLQNLLPEWDAVGLLDPLH